MVCFRDLIWQAQFHVEVVQVISRHQKYSSYYILDPSKAKWRPSVLSFPPGSQETEMLLDNGFIINTITTNNNRTWIKFHASSLPISLQLSCCPPFVRSCLSFMPFIQFISSMHVFDECLSCHSFMDLSISSVTHSPNHPIIPSTCQSICHSFIHACSMP